MIRAILDYALGCWASEHALAQPGGEVSHQIALGGAALNGKPRCDDFFPDYAPGDFEPFHAAKISRGGQ